MPIHGSARPRSFARLLAFGAVTALLVASIAPPISAASPKSQGHASRAEITRVGTTHLGKGSRPTGAPVGTTAEFGPREEEQLDATAPGSQAAKRVPAAHVPNPSPQSVSGAAGATGFEGVSHLQQRFAGTGIYTNTNFSTEPPDQALCVGNGFVVEGGNAAIAVYSTAGTLLAGPTALNQLFGAVPAVTRSTPPVYGDFVGDVKCYYDPEVQRFFVTSFSLPLDPVTGAFPEDEAHVVLAVSATSNPTGAWNVWDLDATNGDGSLPGHPNCPCFGDQPLIGADHFGFYITTNEYSLEPFGGFFNGAQVYAFSKAALASGAGGALTGVHIDQIPLAESIAYTIQPATTPAGGTYDVSRGGTEYFLSALEFNGTVDNRIAVWALTGTSTLGSTNSVSLQSAVLDSESYGQPPDAEQRDGPTPLLDLEAQGLEGVKSVEHLELLAGNDDRMQETKYAAGTLWSNLNTVVKTPNGNVQVGIAWFAVQPTWSGATLGGSVVNQGYVSVNRANVLYGAIAANNDGDASLGMTLVGTSYFPSAAYVDIGPNGAVSDVHVVGAGQGPDDGFTGYVIEGGNGTGRWGDYAAATADENGDLWIANEYIPRSCTAIDNVCRSLFANWGTFVMRLDR
jgi:hypothetical protein